MSATVLLVTGALERPENYRLALRAVDIPDADIGVLTPGPGATRDARALAAAAAGVVLCGGGDIHPRHYGEAPMPVARLRFEEDRDELELAVLEGAREGRTPVFGVCRGLQLINVFFGGTLWQDLPRQFAGSLLHNQSHPEDALIHSVRITSTQTLLGDLLARETPLVNSRHHQGIRRLAPGLAAVGQAPDGLIEAISWGEPGWWLHAVQWHPENLLPMAQGRILWQGFAAAVGERQRRARKTIPN